MRRAAGDAYDGFSYEDLPIEQIDWSMQDEHVRERAARKGQPNEFNVHPEWATEAAFDPDRKLGDSGSRSGVSVKVIGWSSQAGRHLRVLLAPKWKAGEPAPGAWWGAKRVRGP